jgi:starch phosphorylase
MEASGTSGMKVVFNGGVNLSILDGWWDEAYNSEVGWAIGQGEEYSDLKYQDWVEANALYDVLEKEIIPLFYDRGSENLPRGWIAKVKNSMSQLCPVYNTNRMVREYTESFYIQALKQSEILQEDGRKELKKLSTWQSELSAAWKDVRVLDVNSQVPEKAEVGSKLEVDVYIHLGNLLPSDVLVEMYIGQLGYREAITDAHTVPLEYTGEERQGVFRFRGGTEFTKSGRYGFSVRVIPFHRSLAKHFELGMVTWADNV